MTQILESKNQCIWFDQTYFSQVEDKYFDPIYWRESGKLTGEAQGRGTTWFIDAGIAEVALRHYRRGGLLGKCISDSYLYMGWKNTRSFLEFELLSYLESQQVKVPVPIAARALKKGLCYTSDIMTKKIPDAQDLIEITKNENLSVDLLRKIGMEIRKMHDCSVNHTDLNIKNIMIDRKEDVWLIDFDKCMIQKDGNWKAANMNRLGRSIEKENRKGKSLMTIKEYEIIVQAYNMQ